MVIGSCIFIDSCYQRAVLFPVGWVILFHRLLCFGIARQHDVLHQRVQIYLHIGIPPLWVYRVSPRIAGVVGVKPVGRLPGIGHAVAVGIETVRTLPRGESRLGIAIDVADDVDYSRKTTNGTCIGGSAITCLSGVAFIHLIAMERSTHVIEHLLVGSLSPVGSHLAGRGRNITLNCHAGDPLDIQSVLHVVTIQMTWVWHVHLTVYLIKYRVIIHSLPIVIWSILVGLSHIVATDEKATTHTHQFLIGRRRNLCES